MEQPQKDITERMSSYGADICLQEIGHSTPHQLSNKDKVLSTLNFNYLTCFDIFILTQAQMILIDLRESQKRCFVTT